MVFGGVNTTGFVGELLSFPLKTNNWWAMDLKEFGYGNTRISSFYPSDYAIAVVDTGTSLASIPSE